MIAAILENNGYSVKIIDLPALGLSIDYISSLLKSEKPNIVGITSVTPTINSAISLAKKIKGVDPSIIVILGGPHATILPEETLRNVSEIDFVIRGEGEKAYYELESGKNINQIKSLSFKNNGKIFHINYCDVPRETWEARWKTFREKRSDRRRTRRRSSRSWRRSVG